MKIAITGHRPNKLGNDYDLTSPLIQAIKGRIVQILDDKYHNGVLNDKEFVLISGMALGIDTLFAEIAIENNLPFIAAIPCSLQYAKWPSKSKERYMTIISHPLCIRYYVSDKPYTPECMQKRNEWMVDNCDLLIAVWDGTKGGTANCVEYAESVGRIVVRINPNYYK